MPIKPAQDSNANGADGRELLSGSYLIDGKVYFCRILRSRLVMIRVGGGWQSLEQFLLGRFPQVCSSPAPARVSFSWLMRARSCSPLHLLVK